MTPTPLDRRLWAALAGRPVDTRPDAELLDRFARYGERPALEAVVRRYVGLVRGVCRRHLGTAADADDAFQATFLVLLRHAGRGRPPHNVGPWLYAVAVRTCQRLRSRRRFAPLPEVAARTVEPSDVLPILDQELAGLPAKYRDALILCELQQKSRREAAAQLGVTEGTLSSRLSRGRELLRRRLLKHGTLLPAAGLAALAENASAEQVAAAVGLADGAVPAAVAAAVPQAGWGAWRLVALGVVAVGGLAVLPGGELPKAAEPAKPAAVAKAGPAVPDREALQGAWLFEDMPVSEAGLRKRTANGGPAAWHAAEVEAMRSVFRLFVHGDRWFEVHGNDAAGWTFAADPARNPKRIDLRDRSTPPVVGRGIYRLAGDRLTVAFAHTGDRRPADLGPTDHPDLVEVVTYRKGPPADPVTAAAVTPLLGRWKLVRHRSNATAGGQVKEKRFGWLEVLPDALFFQTRADEADNPGPAAATFTLDPSKSHPWIDLGLLTTRENGEPGKRFGVYELSGDTLRLVFGHDRAFRPLDFEVTPDPTPPGEPLKGPNPQVESFEFKRVKEPGA